MTTQDWIDLCLAIIIIAFIVGVLIFIICGIVLWRISSREMAPEEEYVDFHTHEHE